MTDYQRFQVSQQGDVTVIRLVDKELSDLLVQDEFFQEIMSLVMEQQPKKLLIDFEPVNYCTTGIINTLISAKKRILDHDGQVKICNLSQHVHDAFRALNLENTVFKVFSSQADALADFAA